MTTTISRRPPLRGDDHAVARLLGEPGLQAVDAEHRPEQRIAVDELVLAVVELLLRRRARSTRDSPG